MSTISRTGAPAQAHGYAHAARSDAAAEGFEALIAALLAQAPSPLPGRAADNAGADDPGRSGAEASASDAPLGITPTDTAATTPDALAALGVPLSFASQASAAPSANLRAAALPAMPATAPDVRHEPPRVRTASPAPVSVADDSSVAARAPARTNDATAPTTRPLPPPPRRMAEDMRDANPALPASPRSPQGAAPASANERPALAEATRFVNASTPTPPPPIAANAPMHPTASSRAAAEIARQRQLALAATDDRAAPTLDAARGSTGGIAMETLVALRKADGAGADAPRARNEAAASNEPPLGADWSGLRAAPAPAAAASTSAVAPRAFDASAWGAALAQQVSAAALAALRETQVEIAPAGLGPIAVRVRVEAERVDVRFAIEHPVTLGLVRTALPELERLLAASGLNLGQADVAQRDAGGREQPASHESPGTPRSEGSARIAAAEPLSLPALRRRVGLLDDFV